MRGRRIVAGAVPNEVQASGTSDPQLEALREADRVLFPKPLAGVQPGWSWDLPEQVASPGVVLKDTGSPAPASSRLKAPPETGKDAGWIRRLAMPDLPTRLDSRVVRYLKFYRDTARGRAIGRAWAKKSGRFISAIREKLAKRKLPQDLAWLSLIESSHNPTVVSPAGAAGLWQFMPPTAKMYGLTVDRWVDERLDPERSTEAALSYLSDLYQRFGNWDLAMAAYNMGHGGLQRAIVKFNSNDFWELCRYEAGIPWETTLYVPKVLAIAIVMNNKKAFGLSDIVPDSPEKFDTIRVVSGTMLKKVAAAASLSDTQLLELNPQYLSGRVPPRRDAASERSWPVRVTAGRGQASSRRLLASAGKQRYLSYSVRFGDTVEDIAQDHHCAPDALRELNGISGSERLQQDTVLLLPTCKAKKAPPEDKVAVVPSRSFSYTKRRRVFYRALDGDTIEDVARVFGVSANDLVAWNTLDDSAKLQDGMTLQVFVDRKRDLSRVRYLDEKGVKILVSGSAEFHDYYEGLKGNKRLYVTVRSGDTLRSIGNRYGMSVGWMERINRRSRRDELKVGDRLIVYARRGRTSAKSRASAGELDPIKPPRPDLLPVASKTSQQARARSVPAKAGGEAARAD